MKAANYSIPTGESSRTQKVIRIAAAFAGALALLAAAQPATAAPAHKPYSDGTAQKVSEVRTVLRDVS